MTIEKDIHAEIATCKAEMRKIQEEIKDRKTRISELKAEIRKHERQLSAATKAARAKTHTDFGAFMEVLVQDPRNARIIQKLAAAKTMDLPEGFPAVEMEDRTAAQQNRKAENADDTMSSQSNAPLPNDDE